MASNTGIDTQFGWATESTPGTRVVPTNFIEILNESVVAEKNRIERRGLGNGRRLNRGWEAGTSMVSGSVSFELSAETVGDLFKLAIGDVSTTGAGPYTHNFNVGDLESATVQIGRAGTGGTVHPFDYTGMYVDQLTLSASPNEIVECTVDFLGQAEDAGGQTLATPTWGQVSFFTFQQGVLQIASSEECVDAATITLSNTLEQRYCMKSTNAGTADTREAGVREYGGSLTMDFEDLTAYNRFVNGTEASLSLVFTSSGSDTLTISGNVRFDGSTPNVGGPEVVKQELPFVFTSTSADDTAFDCVLVNDDSTA